MLRLTIAQPHETIPATNPGNTADCAFGATLDDGADRWSGVYTSDILSAMMTRTSPRTLHPRAALLLCLTACGADSGTGTDDTGNTGPATSTTTASTPTSEGSDSSSSASSDASTGEPELANFSFFVTSLRAMQTLSGNPLGFGGDLRFGEEGPGAGLRGADKICEAVAEMSMPGSASKQWRAFLSVASDADGKPVHAIDRIGDGPWYDRLGRVVSNTRADLLHDRPLGADPAIQDDLPNEQGIPNKQPDPNLPPEDNHHTLTGSDSNGQLFGAMATCRDWTSAKGDLATEGRPRIGLTFPREGGPVNSMSSNWISALIEAGCAPGVTLMPTPPPGPDDMFVDVGSGGGYGAIYCFALSP